MKIAIITHYYNSSNYGGNLQAYALCRVLENMGFEAEQLSFDRNADMDFVSLLKILAHKILDFPRVISCPKNKIRKRAILSFNKTIPHSETYSHKTIASCIENYDAFITGSDQVWNPGAVCDEYLLKFVPSDKIKISYAASIAKNEIPKVIQNRYREALKDFSAVSVREDKAAELLENISPVKPVKVLDPTLLLSAEEWERLCAETGIPDKYVFCFFLGGSVRQRQLAWEFAKKHNLKLVTLPNLSGKNRKCDKDFGDYALYDVSPNKMISLIRGAESVFTDSFHACVFSHIFRKNFFVFNRDESISMNSRIYSLCSLFNTMNRFCDSEEKCNPDYLEKQPPVDREYSEKDYLEQKKISMAFLINNLKVKK